MNTESNHHKPIIVLVFLLIVGSAVALLWYLKDTGGPTTSIMIEPTPTSSEAGKTSTEPIVEEDTSVVGNPIEGAYKNPFE